MLDDQWLPDDQKQALNESYEALLKNYSAETLQEPGDIERVAQNSLILKSYRDADIKNVFKLQGRSNSFYVLTVEITYEIVTQGKYRTDRREIRELHLLGMVPLPVDLGRVFIRPESLADKVSELFAAKEVDFSKHREFSQKYYVLADNPASIQRSFSKEFMDGILNLKNVVLEISGKSLLVGILKIIDPGDVLRIASFLDKAPDQMIS